VTFRPFQQAREYVQSLKLKNREEWYQYCKSGKKPDDISARPDVAHKKEWKGWGDWLGTGNIASFKREFLPFLEAREYVRSLGLKNVHEWEAWRKSGKRPDYITTHPNRTYKKEWKGIGDWLGTGTVATFNREYWPFEKAREYVHSQGLKSWNEYKKWCTSGKKPDYIPSSPKIVYNNEFISHSDWLGTGFIATRNRKYWPFEKAREYVHSLGFKNTEEYSKWYKSGQKPDYMPANPRGVYEKEWISMGDWLGTGYVASQNREFLPFSKAMWCSISLPNLFIDSLFFF
jgi:Phage-integrase repeat unit